MYTTYNIAVLTLFLYKIGSLVVGLLVAYMGYHLFAKGIWGHAGDLTAEFNQNKLLLKKAAPGTFFAVFGALIISITIWKGFKTEINEVMHNMPVPSDSQPADSPRTDSEDLSDIRLPKSLFGKGN